ncbi:MAG: hypothetical protein V8R80_04090 [Eubacterium sp.]
MEFPYQIPDTGIVVKYLSGYSGIYVEDGSDEKLKNVTAIWWKILQRKRLNMARLNHIGQENRNWSFVFCFAGGVMSS